MQKGYFDVDVKKSELEVSPSRYESYWNLEYDTGKRYRFGEIEFKHSQISDAYLRNILPFRTGDYYDAEKIARLNQQLISSNWFNSVNISPLFDEVSDDKVLPIDVTLYPRKRNSVELGLKYSTSIGVSADAVWFKPWFNSRGHSMKSELSLSKPEQKITVNYNIPLLKSPLVHYYNIKGEFLSEDNNDTQSKSATLTVARHWDLAVWQRAIDATVSYDNFTQGNDSYSTMLIYPSVTISRRRTDGLVTPMWGDFQKYSASLSSKSWGSDINFWSVNMQNTWIRSMGENHRFVARGNYGYINANSFSRIPPSIRFFAGGDRSVRGYGYKSISPVDSRGKLTGANRLLTASGEYQYKVNGTWWGAAFVDIGQATNSFTKNDFKTGAGLGVRWMSVVGAIKLDVAVPFNSNKKTPHIYIGLGPEL